MVNKRTSIKQKKSSIKTVTLKKNAKVVAHSPTVALLNEDFIGRAVWDCLKDNDPDAAVEIIQAHLDAKKSVLEFKGIVVPSAEMFKLKVKNPTIKTLAMVIHASTGK